ncbi:YihY/virulence factor BrkB family protein [Vitreoscilla massiliensis]|uniref:YihY/virulence factor BrkB family protein n=1 Tax=Vitreoscilla massiliensis TaxID=1689272 RepID=A0ABY4E974_9NEIS|nr:YihY/virulence factor BrkB family protein [Vitreoscilla massiliensis]UOO89967.1 YihY/virulence factor BrkB family protein [Vitreoscilla massiliensis]
MKTIFAWLQSFLVDQPENINVLTTKGLLQDLLWRLRHIDISALGAQLAYFFLLSFFPLMIFLLGVIPFLDLNPNQVYQLMQDVMPTEIFGMIKQILEPILTQQRGNLLSLGALGTLWSASKGMSALMSALNQAYQLDVRMTLLDKLWSVLFTLMFLSLILVALLMPIFGGSILQFIREYVDISDAIGLVWNVTRWLLPPILIFTLLLLIYWIVPKTKPRLHIKRILPGTLIASAGWLALTYGFSLYVGQFGNYSATYGSIGGVIVLMLWLYLTGMILIFGGIINACMQRRYDAAHHLRTSLTDTSLAAPR